MLSFERLDVLRKRNKELLARLNNQTENLQRINIASPCKVLKTQKSSSSTFVASDGRSLGRGRAGDPVARLVSVGVTVGGGHANTARDALCKQARRMETTKLAEKKPVRLASEVRNSYTLAEHITRQYHDSEDETHSSLMQDQWKTRPRRTLVDMEQIPSAGVSLDSDRRVTFLSPGQELETAYERHRTQPLLGYDWIAGLLDAESSLTERSEQFFSELRSFRQVNKDECVHSTSSGPSVAAHPLSSPVNRYSNERERASDTHQCTFCYRINSRLFAVPLDPPGACPVCGTLKDEHTHPEKEPAFIRVSIPRSTLLPTYRYKAHRRCSFDPSDSLGLPSHCLSGWSNSTFKPSLRMRGLDLRSSVVVGPPALTAPPAWPDTRLDLSVSRVSGNQCSDQLLDVSRLAQYRVQHPGPAST